MTKPSGEEAFLTRWSRRKLEVQEEATATETEAVLPPDVEPDDLDEAARQQLAEAQALNADDVEKLVADSDFTVFMRKGVAPHIKKLALRKLWRSDPVLANLDGLNDYDGDFTAAATSMKLFARASSWTAERGYGFSAPEVEKVATRAANIVADAPEKQPSALVEPAVEVADLEPGSDDEMPADHREEDDDAPPRA